MQSLVSIPLAFWAAGCITCGFEVCPIGRVRDFIRRLKNPGLSSLRQEPSRERIMHKTDLTISEMYQALLEQGAIIPSYVPDLLTMPTDRIPVIAHLSAGSVLPLDTQSAETPQSGKLERHS